MSEPSRYVSVVPTARLKKKEIPQIANDVTYCLLCPKGFASDIALRNHARMEHIDAYATGNPAAWTSVKEETITIKQEPDYSTTEQVIFEVEPANITMLASQDVSYIIIKNEEDTSDYKGKRIIAKAVKMNAEKVVAKKKKEPPPITGPFECLQPSTLVADGICHQIFFSCCEYSLHHRDEHSKRRKAFRCQVCEKPLACSGDSGPSPFACEICGEGFVTSEDLAGHTAISHIKVKPFECSICHKRFTQQGGLLQHMRMHTGDRPYPCTFCPKSFTQKSGLDQHLRTHTKVKPYQCIVCKKSFCQSVHLRQHMRTHTNVAPFQCGICEKRFKQSNHLNCHLRTHNPATMSDEQRDKYRQLIGEINMSHMVQPQANTHYVETEIQVQTMEHTEEYEPAVLELWAEEKPQNIIEEAGC